ncbi:MAG: PDR/VanB family oxidoreductase [Actinomycetales bacterium]
MALIDVRVAEIIDETPTIKSIRLERADGHPLGVYQAGAHVDVVGPTALTRQYSLCSTPENPDSYTVAVKRESSSRGGSAAMHELQVGDRLQISEPRNVMGIAGDASHHLLIAAGVGITPMLSIARYLDVHGHSFDLHYFARSREEAAFLPLLEEKCPEKLHAHLGITRQDQADILTASLTALPPQTHVYMCGPSGFMDQVEDAATQALPAERIHREAFTASEQPPAEQNTGFEVEFEDACYQIPPERSIAEVLREAGCEIDLSCQEGICGTCIMSVLEGEPEHRDSVLTSAERASGEQITVCVSRSKSPRLVLDWY